jgi:hypothetical protein
MISTASPINLPEWQRFKQICKSVSVLDAILSQDWQYRYYSYNSKWADGEEFCAMRNGHGDELLILFRAEGSVINGMAHEFYPKNKEKITKDIPDVFYEFMFGEPVHSTGTTFCLWNNNNLWEIGELEDYNDGSADMLKIFDDNPQTYINWATEYYEDHFLINDKTIEIVSSIYHQRPVEKGMVLSVVTSLDDWTQLETDLEEINYPYSWK